MIFAFSMTVVAAGYFLTGLNDQLAQQGQSGAVDNMSVVVLDAGHGGMDYIMDYRLVYCLRNGLPLDMDVYDLAEWCCMADLTKLSIENSSAPVAIPDFTRGAWNKVKGYRHAFAK